MTTSDERNELFRQAVTGNHDAFWRLVMPHRGLIYSVALGLLHNHERAEEQLHESLVTAFRSLPNLRDVERLPAWLYSLTHNRVLELLRREQRLRGALQSAARTTTPVVPVAELLDRDAWLTRMEEALGHLPEPFRVILALKYTNDYSCREIAGILELSVPAVKSRLFEARKLLRALTEKLGAHSEGESHGMP